MARNSTICGRLLLVCLLVASACSSGDDEGHANYATLPAVADSVTTEFTSTGEVNVRSDVELTGSASTSSAVVTETADEAAVVNQTADLGEWSEDEVFSFVDLYLFVRDRVVLGEEHPSALEGYAAPAVVAAVADQQAINLAGLDALDLSARQDLQTFPYLIEAHREGDRIAAVMCSEQWVQSIHNAWRTVFVDEAFVLDIVDGELRVSDHQVAHDGSTMTEGLTCLPGIIGERAVDGARKGIEVTDAIELNPELAATTDFTESFAGLALASMEELALTADTGTRRISPVETRYTPLGVDTSKGWDFIAVVSVCRHFPEGAFVENLATGEIRQLNPDAVPGYSVESLVYVYVEDKPRIEGGDEFLWNLDAATSEGCW